MAVSMLRLPRIAELLSVGKTKLEDDFIHHPGGDEFVPGTNNTVRRLHLVPLGERSRAGFSDEVARLIEELRAFRDAASKEPKPKGRFGPRKKQPPATAETSP